MRYATNVAIETFRIPPSTGHVDPECFFKGRKVKIDNQFHEFAVSIGPRYSIKGFSGSVHQTRGGSSADIVKAFELQRLTPEHIFVLLHYLNMDGSHLLEIPKGEDEANIILGFSNGVCYYVEHEFENDVDEIHLHARPATRDWGADKPLVIKF